MQINSGQLVKRRRKPNTADGNPLHRGDSRIALRVHQWQRAHQVWKLEQPQRALPRGPRTCFSPAESEPNGHKHVGARTSEWRRVREDSVWCAGQVRALNTQVLVNPRLRMVVACCGYEWLRVVSEWCDALVKALTIEVLLVSLLHWFSAVQWRRMPSNGSGLCVMAPNGEGSLMRALTFQVPLEIIE